VNSRNALPSPRRPRNRGIRLRIKAAGCKMF
jgi:hypothetical protein